MSSELTVSSFDLPDDVFKPGEAKPTKPKKKVLKKETPLKDEAAAAKKRKLGASEDVGEH